LLVETAHIFRGRNTARQRYIKSKTKAEEVSMISTALAGIVKLSPKTQMLVWMKSVYTG